MIQSVKRLFYIAIFAFTIQSCNQLQANDGTNAVRNWVNEILTPSNTTLEKVESGYEINGKLENTKYHLLILWELTADKLIFIDSVRTNEQGEFQIKGNTKDVLLCQLQMGPEASIYLELEKNSKIDLSLSIVGSYVDYSIKSSSATNQALQKLLLMNNSFTKEVRLLESKAQQLTKAETSAQELSMLRQEYGRITNERESYLKNLAMKQKDGLIPYFILTFTGVENPGYELMKHAVVCASKSFPSSKYSQMISQRFKTESALMVGAEAPDIKLKNSADQVESLKDLRGKYVLIDFWASWCGPCRRENPNVKRVYAEYKDKGFEIFGVSLDNDKDRWLGAIKADGLEWHHVSDLKGWQSEAAKLYQVHSIPQTILLDKEGKIIAKGLRGEALENELKRLLGDN